MSFSDNILNTGWFLSAVCSRIPFEICAKLWVVVGRNVKIANSCEFDERTEYEEEAACEVNINGLHVGYLGHVVVTPCDYGQQSQHCSDSCKRFN